MMNCHFENSKMDVFNAFKKHDYILNNKSNLLAEKIMSLVELWNNISEYDLSNLDLNQLIHLIDWAILHTLNVVLTAEWQLYIEIFKVDMLNVIEKANARFNRIITGFNTRFQKLLHVVLNTWAHPVLEKLMKISDVDLTAEDAEFFKSEGAHLVSVRLMKLCESNCEDLALNLGTAFLEYLKGEKNLRVTANQIWFVFDLRITLLLKFKENQKLEDELKVLNCEEGIYLINRFVNKKPSLMKIWKYAPKIAAQALQIILEKVLIDNRTDLHDVFKQLLETYVSVTNDPLEEFCLKFKKLAETSDLNTFKIMCEYFKKIKTPTLKTFVVEIFIKSLTAFMNELEIQKDIQDLDKMEIITTSLAQIFCSLAEFMSEKIKVARECALTAFSLDPTKERLDHLEVLAKESGVQISVTNQEWTCKLHPPTQPTDEETLLCPECHGNMAKPQLDVPLKANLALNEAIQTLDLPETLCEDLIVCISNPRYRVLSWYLPWTLFYRVCLMYLKDQQATKNFVTELKFLDIDYSMFEGMQQEPLDEYEGIEKGYEKYLDKNFIPTEESEDDLEDGKSENCAIDGDDYDPNSIESLKKILSLQNSQEEEFNAAQAQQDDFSDFPYFRNPRSILKSSYEKENYDFFPKENSSSMDTKHYKRKARCSSRDQNNKIPRRQ